MLGIFAVGYTLLMALWPVWGGVYSRFYRSAAAVLFASPGSRAIVHFHPSRDTGDEVKVTFCDQRRVDALGRPVPLLRIAHDVRYGDYIYLAFLAALILATPIPPRRRAWALLWGLVLMHVFMAFRLGILILYLLNSEQVALLSLNGFWRQALLLNIQVFTINILPGFVVAIFIWALVCFRRGDWARLVMPPPPPPAAPRCEGALHR
ncbi:MAG: hypothetical protein JXB13_06375 [Phycisphaerae bacterium]|nr:hypothetical protein [Phycisphaerae bacterium]